MKSPEGHKYHDRFSYLDVGLSAVAKKLSPAIKAEIVKWIKADKTIQTRRTRITGLHYERTQRIMRFRREDSSHFRDLLKEFVKAAVTLRRKRVDDFLNDIAAIDEKATDCKILVNNRRASLRRQYHRQIAWTQSKEWRRINEAKKLKQSKIPQPAAEPAPPETPYDAES